jgi:prepilin-type N-terminal cleavage/methylation domain-containing protein
MKIRSAISASARRPARLASCQAFTLPEILIASTILLLVVGGILSAHLFGLRMLAVNTTKLSATEWSRKTFGRMADEVRSCDSAYIGTVTNIGSTNFFQQLLDGELEQGTSLMINTTTNSFILYFLNPSDQTLRRTTGQVSTAVILADSITNTAIFTAQDFSGNILTNLSGNAASKPVIHLTLEFYQPQKYLQDPDYYKLETSMLQRVTQ